MQEHEPMRENEIGEVIHYWSDLRVAGVRLNAPLEVGDRIHVLGHTSDFKQSVGSMQINHQQVSHADAGSDIGIRVAEHAREHDKVYKIVEMSDIGAGESEL